MTNAQLIVLFQLVVAWLGSGGVLALAMNAIKTQSWFPQKYTGVAADVVGVVLGVGYVAIFGPYLLVAFLVGAFAGLAGGLLASGYHGQFKGILNPKTGKPIRLSDALALIEELASLVEKLRPAAKVTIPPVPPNSVNVPANAIPQPPVISVADASKTGDKQA
jgi:hypothetical protein